MRMPTPAGNGLMDLWAEFRVLDMGKRLGRFISNYCLNYFTPDKRNGQIVYSYKPLPFAEQAIYDAISDITISMKSTDHLKMPELVSTAYPAVMSNAETRTYEDFKSEYVMKLGKDKEITAANAAVLCGKLTQMANGAIYDEFGECHLIHDRKLDALEDIIEAANGKPLLVAYWYQSNCDRIEKRLHELHIPFSRMDSSESTGCTARPNALR